MRWPVPLPGTWPAMSRPPSWSRARAAAPWTGSSTRCSKGRAPMLLELTRWLEQLQSLFGLFGYLTFRGILSALTALALSLWWGPWTIRTLAEFKGQPIRTDGPQTHFSKAGTPTMGGALILMTVLASVRRLGDLRNKSGWLVLAAMASFW